MTDRKPRLFLWCEDLACDWSKHNKHSRHILGVHGNIITAVKLNVRHRSASQNLLIYSVNDVGYKYQ